VNEYALYGYERESRGAPDANGSALLQMWLDAGLELGNHTFAHTDLHANALNADYFDELARMMKKRGYAFISLNEALRDEAYDSADTYTGAESLNWLARWAVTRGVKNTENALDDCPEVPEFVVKAADGAP